MSQASHQDALNKKTHQTLESYGFIITETEKAVKSGFYTTSQYLPLLEHIETFGGAFILFDAQDPQGYKISGDDIGVLAREALDHLSLAVPS